MVKIMAVSVLLTFLGCAEQRVSLRDLAEYNAGIRLAESEGIDTAVMHRQLAEMLASYSYAPGEDPSVQVARQLAYQQGWAMASQAVLNAQMADPGPPLTFNQWRNGR